MLATKKVTNKDETDVDYDGPCCSSNYDNKKGSTQRIVSPFFIVVKSSFRLLRADSTKRTVRRRPSVRKTRGKIE